MTDYKAFFGGSRVTLLGLGLLGRGVGDARFLAQCGAKVLVTDLKSENELAPSLKKLEGFKNITYRLGEHRLEDFRDRDLVVKAAGVPLNSPYIAEAKESSIPVRMSADLFAELAGVPVVGVTGTRGKSTVTHLIAHGLKYAGRKVLLGGNVRGVSNLELLSKVEKDSTAVLELDSWQLQGFGEAKISPHIAVFTNLLVDHQNYYKDNPPQYFEDKANIFAFQKPGDHLVVGAQVAERILSHNPPVAPVVPKKIPADWRLKLIGEHNRENAALAAEALRVLGVSEGDIKVGLETFEPVEGRLQLVREQNGVKIYNDNNATTPEATLAALRALKDKHIVLIAGGADKALPLEELALEMEKCKNVILLAGTGTPRLKNLLKNYTEAPTMQDAVRQALKAAQPGDAILFSPAFASFGLFKNEYDRNDQFLAAVQALP